MVFHITATSISSTTTETDTATASTFLSTPNINGKMARLHTSPASTNNTSSTSSAPASSSKSRVLARFAYPVKAFTTRALVAPFKSLKYVAAGWRVRFKQSQHSEADPVTVSKLYGVLNPDHDNHAVANDDAEGSLRACVHRYGDLVEFGPAPCQRAETDTKDPTIQAMVSENEERLAQENSISKEVNKASTFTQKTAHVEEAVVEEIPVRPYEPISLISTDTLDFEEFGFMSDLIDIGSICKNQSILYDDEDCGEKSVAVRTEPFETTETGTVSTSVHTTESAITISDVAIEHEEGEQGEIEFNIIAESEIDSGTVDNDTSFSVEEIETIANEIIDTEISIIDSETFSDIDNAVNKNSNLALIKYQAIPLTAIIPAVDMLNIGAHKLESNDFVFSASATTSLAVVPSVTTPQQINFTFSSVPGLFSCSKLADDTFAFENPASVDIASPDDVDGHPKDSLVMYRGGTQRDEDVTKNHEYVNEGFISKEHGGIQQSNIYTASNDGESEDGRKERTGTTTPAPFSSMFGNYNMTPSTFTFTAGEPRERRKSADSHNAGNDMVFSARNSPEIESSATSISEIYLASFGKKMEMFANEMAEEKNILSGRGGGKKKGGNKKKKAELNKAAVWGKKRKGGKKGKKN